MSSIGKKLIVIVGPTSSGKSELAVKIAKKYNGEIISADSRQVYRGMDIGTGKVPKDNKKLKFKIQNSKLYYYRGIPHHLLDVASPKRTFTVTQYKKLAERALKDIVRRGKLPIITGGTGFYIDALLYNITIPDVKPNKELRNTLEKQTTKKLYEELKKRDPRRARTIDIHNKRRLIRALEIIHATNSPIPPTSRNKSYSNVLKNIRIRKKDVIIIGITLPSEKLKENIGTRLRARIRQGMISEVKRLRKEGTSWKRLHGFGLEYRAVADYLQNKITKQELVIRLEKEIWHYAKRQITWWRRNKDIRWAKSERELLMYIKNRVQKSPPTCLRRA